jgi:lipid II:glycine glycyltransferase (peptidoglycan interpeptide bridge formation enzyme)
MGVVLAGKGPFKILVAPYGPILSGGNESLAEEIIIEFKTKAKSKGAFMAQLSLPVGNLEENANEKHLLPITLPNQVFQKVNKGLIFKYVTGLSAFRAVRLFPESEDTYEKVLSNYTASTRRNVKKSDKVGNSLYLPTATEQIKEAYKVIELNSENQGYSIRSWNDFGATLVEMVSKGQYFLACCKNEGDLKGVLIIFEVGQKLHYIMGGTLREEVDLKVGHFLHDQVIQIGIEKGYDCYDISMRGSDGVVRFKEGFGGEIIEITEPRYWVLKPLQFAAFQKLLPWVQKNKSKIAKILSKLK